MEVVYGAESAADGVSFVAVQQVGAFRGGLMGLLDSLVVNEGVGMGQVVTGIGAETEPFMSVGFTCCGDWPLIVGEDQLTGSVAKWFRCRTGGHWLQHYDRVCVEWELGVSLLFYVPLQLLNT